MVNIIQILIGLALLLIGFVILITGINTTTVQITNLYEVGIGVIVMVVGGIVVAKQ